MSENIPAATNEQTPAGSRSFENIAFLAADSEGAEQARRRLIGRYGNVRPEDADVVVALGGDGLMLQTLHRMLYSEIPIYGMNRGSVGFLMNEYREDKLIERLQMAEDTVIYPLIMQAHDVVGCCHIARAINEVSMLRQTFQAAKLEISIDDKVRMNELICDGVLVSTPAGSTAYNLSAHGPILPIDARMLALTPISPFRPRRWRGALLPNNAEVTIRVLESGKRPVSAVADHTEFRNIETVQIKQDTATRIHMMFDPGHNLDERILNEQFGY